MADLTVGDAAPDFDLPGTFSPGETEAVGSAGERRYRLTDYRGQVVVLVFYPGDNTPVCTSQLRSYTDDIDQFSELGAQMLAISPQDMDSHLEFSSEQGGFGFPLLADTDKTVGRAFGVLGPIGFYRRSVIVVDGNGTIRYAHRSAAGTTYRRTNELVKAVRMAQAATAAGTTG
jgi:peroxiredoxin Q/BCP